MMMNIIQLSPEEGGGGGGNSGVIYRDAKRGDLYLAL